jgi:WD40 repeat protein
MHAVFASSGALLATYEQSPKFADATSKTGKEETAVRIYNIYDINTSRYNVLPHKLIIAFSNIKITMQRDNQVVTQSVGDLIGYSVLPHKLIIAFSNIKITMQRDNQVVTQSVGDLIGPTLAFSSDGMRLAMGGHQLLKVFDVTRPAELLTLAGHGPNSEVLALAFSPDGTRLASTGDDGTLKVWDAATGTLLLTCNDYVGAMNCVLFDRSGSRVVTGSRDGSVKFWDVTTGLELLTLRGNDLGIVPSLKEGIVCLAFTPDGTRLASASIEGTVRVWDATPLPEAR